MTVMRSLLALVATPALFLALALPAAASCRPPEPVSENAARAQLVVHGVVTAAGNGAVTLRVDQVLKGSSPSTLRVFVGPGRGASGGGIAATSVDYSAAVGTDHVLYVIKGEDGQLETNACVGSHAGASTAEETAFFGAGSSPSPDGESPTVTGINALGVRIDPLWAALAALGVVGAAIAFARRVLASRSAEG